MPAARPAQLTLAVVNPACGTCPTRWYTAEGIKLGLHVWSLFMWILCRYSSATQSWYHQRELVHNVLLPLLFSLHLRCHDFFAIPLAVCRASETDRPMISGAEIFSFTIIWASSLAFWSASIFPCIPLWLGILTTFTQHEKSWSCMLTCWTFWNISGCLLTCVFFVTVSMALLQSLKTYIIRL